MSGTIFKEGNDVIGEMDWKLDKLCKAAAVVIFILLIITGLLALILSLVIFGVTP